MNNYETHRWETREISTPDIHEYIVVCMDCGIENIGDPIEFPEIIYTDCAEECD